MVAKSKSTTKQKQVSSSRPSVNLASTANVDASKSEKEIAKLQAKVMKLESANIDLKASKKSLSDQNREMAGNVRQSQAANKRLLSQVTRMADALIPLAYSPHDIKDTHSRKAQRVLDEPNLRQTPAGVRPSGGTTHFRP